MQKYAISDQLPEFIQVPLAFREHGRTAEGEVSHPIDIVKKFEPMDVLDGATELVDQNGNMITIHSEDPKTFDNNQYSKNYEELYFTIKRA